MAVAAPNKGANAAEISIPANQSLYLQNLPEKLQKHDLKRALYMLFSSYGVVLDVTALKTSKMRGQAHVLFRDVQSATQAMRHCQGYDFFGREMKISYAKSRSHTLAKLTGTFYDPEQQATQAVSKLALQPPQSSLPAPPGTLPGPASALPPPPGFPAQPNGLQPPPAKSTEEEFASPSGIKRPREDSDDEGGEAPMEEDSDESGEMEMSDEEE